MTDINQILDQLSKEFDAERTQIEDVEWKGEPQSLRLQKYMGTDWAPLYQAAVAVDLAIIQAPLEHRKEAEARCTYIKAATDFFLEYSSAHSNEELPCSCGGVLRLKLNRSTKMGFFSCSRWTDGCKTTKNLLKQDSTFSKRRETKLTGRSCPKCGKMLIVRIAKTGKHMNKEFVGCTGFPSCSHTEKLS